MWKCGGGRWWRRFTEQRREDAHDSCLRRWRWWLWRRGRRKRRGRWWSLFLFLLLLLFFALTCPAEHKEFVIFFGLGNVSTNQTTTAGPRRGTAGTHKWNILIIFEGASGTTRMAPLSLYAFPTKPSRSAFTVFVIVQEALDATLVGLIPVVVSLHMEVHSAGRRADGSVQGSF